MAVNQVSICNSALVKIGADLISSITQDTRSARLLNAIYSQIRDSVLRAHPWNFAIKRAELFPTNEVPISEYDFTYDLPADLLRVLDPDSNDIDFVIEGNRKLLTTEPAIKLRYIYRNEDESSYDPCFAEALAWRLAAELGYALTQSSTVSDQAMKAYKAVLAEARSMDGAEGIIKNLEATDWTDARR